MAKQAKEERLIHCSGPGWQGDGSKSTSACPFGDTMTTTAYRYKCFHCLERQTPESIHVGPDGIKPKTKRAPEEDKQKADLEPLAKAVEEGVEDVLNGNVVVCDDSTSLDQIAESQEKKAQPTKKRKGKRKLRF